MAYLHRFLPLLGLIVLPNLGLAQSSDSLTFLSYNGKYTCKVNGISRDGSVLYGSVPDFITLPATFDGEWHPFKIGFARNTEILGLSGDSKVSFGIGTNGLPWRRSGTKATQLITAWQPGIGGGSVGVSFDGSIAYFASYDYYSIWQASTGFQKIEPPAGYAWVTANGMTDDGKTLVGQLGLDRYSSRAAISRDGVWETYNLPGYTLWALQGVSGDGGTLFAGGWLNSDPTSLFRPIIIRSGVPQPLETLFHLNSSGELTATSSDETISIGYSGFPTLWDREGHVYEATTLLKALNLLSEGSIIVQFRGMSSDGKTVVGKANTLNGEASFLLKFENRNWPNILNPISGSRLIQGDTITARVQIARPAPRGGVRVSLSSPSSNLILPAQVVIPSGKNFVNIKITAKFGGTSHDELTRIDATSPVNSFQNEIIVYDIHPEVSLAGTLPSKSTRDADLTISGRATKSEPITFTARANRPEVLSVPSTVQIDQFNNSARFKVTAGTVARKTPVRLTFQYGAYKVIKNVFVTP